MLETRNIIIALLGLCLLILTYIAFFKDNKASVINNTTEQQAQSAVETVAEGASQPAQYQHYEPEPEIYNTPVTIEERREALKIQEQSSPLMHLVLSTNLDVLTKKKGLLKLQKKFAGYELDMSIYNSATLATFKDAEVTIIYRSATNSIISRESFTIYSYFPPGETVKKSQKITFPNGTESYNFLLTKASVAYDR